MDTIIYFLNKKGLKEPLIEPVGLKSHMLIRVTLDVEAEEWFGTTLRMPCLPSFACPSEILPEEVRRQKTQEWRPGRWEQEETKGKQPGESGRRKEAGEGRSGGRESRKGLPRPLQALRQLHRHGEKRLFLKKENRAEKKRREAEMLERERLLTDREERLRRTEAAMGKLFHDVMELAGEERDCYCVYENSVRRALIESGARNPEETAAETSMEKQAEDFGEPVRGEKCLPVLWQRCFELKEFRDYCGRFWVEQLMPQAVQPHFVILGTAPCLFAVLEKYAGKMKSLRWIISEADCTGELLEFVEDFYTEYGLAITLQPLEGPAAWKRFRLSAAVPVNILDFTGEVRAAAAVSEIAGGSVWLDMLSLEEKRRRIAGRNIGIRYISLKERWKYAQRRCKSPVLP